jgi:hypothetical protein
MFFRQAELTTLLKSCNAGLEQALEVFMVRFSSALPMSLINSIPTGKWGQCGEGYRRNKRISTTGPPGSA